MKYHLVNINLLIVLVLILNQGHLGQAAPNNEQPSYNLLLLTQTWLPAHCEDENRVGLDEFCKVIGQYQKWSIHGLWPSGSASNSLEYCASSQHKDKQQLNMEEIKGIKENLQKNWVDIYAVNSKLDTGKNFWEHEWKKHGTCAVNLNSANPQKQYFDKALHLFRHFNMETVINTIRLNPKETYTSKRIFEKINAEINYSQYMCVRKGEKQFLAEVRTCFDRRENLKMCPRWNSKWAACQLDKPIIFPGGKVGTVDEATTKKPTNTPIGNSVNIPSATGGHNSIPTGANSRITTHGANSGASSQGFTGSRPSFSRTSTNNNRADQNWRNTPSAAGGHNSIPTGTNSRTITHGANSGASSQGFTGSRPSFSRTSTNNNRADQNWRNTPSGAGGHNSIPTGANSRTTTNGAYSKGSSKNIDAHQSPVPRTPSQRGR